MMVTSTMVGLIATSVERESVASEVVLAELRAHWAMMGMLDFGLSRAAYRTSSAGGLCAATDTSGGPAPCADDTARSSALSALIAELNAADTAGEWRWTYPGYTDGAYQLGTSVQAISDGDQISANGYLSARLQATPRGALPKPRTLPRRPALSTLFCINASAQCAAGVAANVDDQVPSLRIAAVTRDSQVASGQ
jgi:hypothetical protein